MYPRGYDEVYWVDSVTILGKVFGHRYPPIPPGYPQGTPDRGTPPTPPGAPGDPPPIPPGYPLRGSPRGHLGGYPRGSHGLSPGSPRVLPGYPKGYPQSTPWVPPGYPWGAPRESSGGLCLGVLLVFWGEGRSRASRMQPCTRGVGIIVPQGIRRGIPGRFCDDSG